jgi:hypothetical protein
MNVKVAAGHVKNFFFTKGFLNAHNTRIKTGKQWRVPWQDTNFSIMSRRYDHLGNTRK